MKLSTTLLVAFVLYAGAKGMAQTVSLSVTNMPLEKVCKEIERQTGYYFVYSTDMNKESRLVTIQVSGVSIEETLKMIFTHLPFSYQIIDKTIVINTVKRFTDPQPNEKVLDKEIKVQGIVLNAQGQPLVGATITIKKTGKSTLTNAKGEFTLSEVPENSVLVISNIGYAPRQLIAKEGEQMRIRMEEAANDLDAMVIKGYYNTSGRMNTGSVVTIKGEDIQKQPVTDPLQALEGRVAGLNITQYSGVPGAYATVQLRGRSSIANGLDPLYIVDGVPYSNQSLTNAYIGGGPVGTPTTNRLGAAPQNKGMGLSPFNNINPNDIESVTILKDADATAIYGSRGANGVIIITTKKGKAGLTKIDINVYTGGGTPSRKMKLLNTQQYLQMRREAFVNDGTMPDPNIDFDLTLWDTTRYTDWQKLLLDHTAHFTNAQVSISGGNSNSQFLIGLGYSNQGTAFPGKYYDQKASVHFSITNNSTNQRFQTQFTGSYVNDINKLPSADFTSYTLLPPNAPPIFDKNGNLNWALYGGSATFLNPLAATYNQSKAITNSVIGNLVLSYIIFPGLKISTNFGYTNNQLNQNNLQLSESTQPPYNTDPYSRSNSFGTGDSKGWIIEPQLSYGKRISNGLLEATFGTTFQENTTSSIAQTASGFVSDALIENPVAAKTIIFENYFTTQYRYNAIYARLGYALKERYLINFTARRDGSSRFGPSRQFGNFGAIGAGYIFTREDIFSRNIPWLSYGKLRASYGVTGNDQLGDYRFLDTYTPYPNGTYMNISGLYPTQITNPYFAWERNRKLEGAIDLGFWHDRVLLTMAYYRNRTGNQLVGIKLPSMTGYGTVQGNLPALIQNSGFEFTAATLNVQREKFKWTTSINLSFPRNKLLSYPGIQNSPYNKTYSVGKPLSTRYLYHYTGVDPQTGLYTFATKNGDNNPAYGIDNYFTKGVTQDYFGGIQNAFNYKGFQVDIFIQFVKQLGLNYLTGFSPPGVNQNQPLAILRRWRNVGDRANIQQFSQTYSLAATEFNNLQLSDASVSDASFIRLKNLSLSYTLNTPKLKNSSFQNIRVYIQAQNLFTISSYQGVDPETQGLILPPMRMITAGLQVGL